MKFVPKELPEENVNVTGTHPLKELFVLVGGILGVLACIYIVLGVLVGLIAPRISPEVEKKLGVLYAPLYKDQKGDLESREYLQTILDGLQTNMKEKVFEYQVHLAESEEVNAYALPGGHIMVCSGLLDVVESENEIAMVLAHELGHFVNRDHLRQIGRGLVFAVISIIVFGEKSLATNMMQKALGSLEAQFSQQQEALADRYGLDLLYTTYGHAAGATDFFQHLQEKKKDVRFMALFASHPYTPERIEILEAYIEQQGLKLDEKIPLAGFLKQEEKPQEKESADYEDTTDDYEDTVD